MNRSASIATIIIAGLCCGCDVPNENTAHRIHDDGIPFELAGTTTTSTGTLEDHLDEILVKVYLVRDERLSIVTHIASPADPTTVLALLAQGPNQAETEDGLRTALVPDLAVIVEIIGDVITIDLDGEFSALAPTEQRLALAQITFSMTQLESINAVRFLVAGQPASVPRGDGSSTDMPVSPDDYGDFAPR